MASEGETRPSFILLERCEISAFYHNIKEHLERNVNLLIGDVPIDIVL